MHLKPSSAVRLSNSGKGRSIAILDPLALFFRLAQPSIAPNPQIDLMQNLAQIEASLWEAADNLRANSKLNASEYSMPVLGLIFLRHASNRFDTVKAEIKPKL